MKKKLVSIVVFTLIIAMFVPVSSLTEIALQSNDEVIIDMIQQLDETIYLKYLENLTAFGPRVTNTSACYAAGEYIYNEFQSMGLEVRYHNWSFHASYGDYQGSNIEATLHGVNETSDEIYIVSAHYDSVFGSPGADDDGSGVAAVMSTAYLFSQHTFNHTIRFVTFCGEEQGLLGSREYVAEAYENGDNIIADLQADRIGYAGNETQVNNMRIFANDASEWLSNFTVNVSEQYYEYIPLNPIPSGYSGRSDHRRFWENGYDALFYNELVSTPYYHSPQDTIENINLTFALKASKLVMATLAELAQLCIIHSPPAADFTYTPPNPTSNDIIQFTDISVDLDGTIVSWWWDFGDHYYSDLQNPKHCYYIDGIYTITLTVTDDDGLTDTIQKRVVVSTADLIIQDFSAEFVSHTTNHISAKSISKTLIKLTATIKNNGNADITIPFQVSFFGCTDGSSNDAIHGNTIGIGAVKIPSLRVGETAEATIYWTSPLERHTITVFADSKNVIEESNENNNWAKITVSYLLWRSLKETIDVYTQLNQKYETTSAEEVIALAQEAISGEAYTNPREYVMTMKKIAELERRVGMELEGQMPGLLLLHRYQDTVERLIAVIDELIGDHISLDITWEDAENVAGIQLQICRIVEQMLR